MEAGQVSAFVGYGRRQTSLIRRCALPWNRSKTSSRLSQRLQHRSERNHSLVQGTSFKAGPTLDDRGKLLQQRVEQGLLLQARLQSIPSPQCQQQVQLDLAAINHTTPPPSSAVQHKRQNWHFAILQNNSCF
jgi:hypothetical protein